MAGELEDFLRRAAQRRGENAAARPARPQPQPPRRPEYTDRNRERSMSMPDPDEEVVVADLVPSVVEETRSGRPRAGSGSQPLAETSLSATNRPLGDAGKRPLGHAGRAPHVASQVTDNTEVPASATVKALLLLMTDPAGIRQAILAREILDPPHHRW